VPTPTPQRTRDRDTNVETAPTSEVDFRGMRVDELQPALDHALDDAVLSDMPYLRIIHGKGTGALRDRVQEILGHDPRVRSFAFAAANQGGDGVTVVELA
jgi:DNA mismatch repair protein MutS2